jgi:O-antigen/teichoic acid export membrane protein
MPDDRSTPASPKLAEQGGAMSLRRLAVRGTIWTILGFGFSQTLRLGFNLIVTRMLYPELFGLLALVNTFAAGLAQFCDVGIEPAVVRDPHGAEPDFLNTAWTLQILRGIVIAALCVALAWPMAAFYGDRRLLRIIAVTSLGSLAAGFNSTSLMMLTRDMAVRTRITFEVGSQFLSGLVMIAWAYFNPTVWALVAAPVSWAIIRLIWSHLLPHLPTSSRRDHIGWNDDIARTILRFGRWIWVSTLLTFLALQFDRLILGKLLDLRTFGIYGLVAAISEVPRNLSFAVGNNVIYPAYARFAGLARGELRAKILRNRWPLLAAMSVPIGLLSVAGDGVVRVLLDKRYAAGAWMLPVLALGIWPSVLANTIDSSLVAIGRPARAAAANVAKIVFTVAGIPLAFHARGIAGAVIVVALNDLPYYAQIAWGLTREGLGCLAQDMKATLLLAAIIASLLLVRYWMGLGNPLRGMF